MMIVGRASATRYVVDRNCPPTVAGETPAGAVWPAMVDALWAAALEHSIDPVVMVAQSAHETGWGRYAGRVPATFFNTAGMKVRDPGTLGDATLAHAQFASWQAGARAHAQHLLGYTGDFTLLPGEELLAPRRLWLREPWVTTVEQLGGRWAPSTDYGLRVVAVAQRLSGMV